MRFHVERFFATTEGTGRPGYICTDTYYDKKIKRRGGVRGASDDFLKYLTGKKISDPYLQAMVFEYGINK